METVNIRPAHTGDLTELTSLLPQLADFNVPARRNPQDLWQGDVQLLENILRQQTTEAFADVAVNADDKPIGLIIVSLRPELMSHAPSAHLEAIVVNPDARGIGLGKQLLQHAEQRAQQAGATSITLHVFANNQRARTLYEQSGYDSELIRAIKWF